MPTQSEPGANWTGPRWATIPSRGVGEEEEEVMEEESSVPEVLSTWTGSLSWKVSDAMMMKASRTTHT